MDSVPPHGASSCEKMKFFTRPHDLAPLDYFLWGVVKYRAHKNKAALLNDLKDNFWSVISEIAHMSKKNIEMDI